MEYNPYTQEYNHLQLILENKNCEKKRLSDELSWFDSADISTLYSSLGGMENSKDKLQSLIDTIEQKIEGVHTKTRETKSYTKTLFNPLNWFNVEQKTYRKKLNRLNKELNAKQENIEQREKSLSETNESIKKYKKEIDKYKNFDRRRVSDEAKSLDREIVSLEEEFKRVSELKNNVDIELQPVLEQINNYELLPMQWRKQRVMMKSYWMN